MSTDAELFTIGQLARRTGVPARTIRFWSDAGLVPPCARSGSGYRLYDAAAAARRNSLAGMSLPAPTADAREIRPVRAATRR